MYIELQFSLTPEDIQEFHRDSPKALRTMKVTTVFGLPRRAAFWGAVVITAIMLLVVFHGDPNAASSTPTTQPKNSAPVEFFSTLLPYFLIFAFVWYFIFRRKLQAKLAFRNSPRLGDARKIVITDETLTLQSATITTNEKWSHCLYFQEGAAVFSLWSAKQFANAIPKRAFASEEQMREFSEFARTHAKNGR